MGIELWSTLSANGDALIGVVLLAALPLGVVALLLFRAMPTP